MSRRLLGVYDFDNRVHIDAKDRVVCVNAPLSVREPGLYLGIDQVERQRVSYSGFLPHLLGYFYYDGKNIYTPEDSNEKVMFFWSK